MRALALVIPTGHPRVAAAASTALFTIPLDKWRCHLLGTPADHALPYGGAVVKLIARRWHQAAVDHAS